MTCDSIATISVHRELPQLDRIKILHAAATFRGVAA
jgi:hypothetical protein